MAAKIPVTVITGFLGSGKTTLIRHLLQHNQGRRIAVLVNEFGELGIDGELLRSCSVCPEELLETNSDAATASNIVELTNGCLCCTVQEEFLPTMLELLKRREALDCILIETSGLALPKPLIKAFRWPEIRHAATVDGVITVVDCEAVASGTLVGDLSALEAQRQADPNLDHETPIQELFEDQLACADLVVLNKTDLVDATAQEQVVNFVQQELPRAVKIVPSAHGTLEVELLLGFNAAVEADLAARPSHHDDEEDHDHDDTIISTHCILRRSFDPDKLQNQLKALVQEQEIYRIKGFVAVPNKSMRMVLQGVGARFDQFYDRSWYPEELRETQLVFIGRDLDAEQIESQLASFTHLGMDEQTKANVIVSGRVQGVFFRAETRDAARRLGVAGWVRNLPDGRVEAVFEGSRDAVEAIVNWCYKGSPGAQVTDVNVKYAQPEGLAGFQVR